MTAFMIHLAVFAVGTFFLLMLPNTAWAFAFLVCGDIWILLASGIIPDAVGARRDTYPGDRWRLFLYRQTARLWGYRAAQKKYSIHVPTR